MWLRKTCREESARLTWSSLIIGPEELLSIATYKIICKVFIYTLVPCCHPETNICQISALLLVVFISCQCRLFPGSPLHAQMPASLL
jgi:hypothetical protein